jgi:hypothetical protein
MIAIVRAQVRGEGVIVFAGARHSSEGRLTLCAESRPRRREVVTRSAARARNLSRSGGGCYRLLRDTILVSFFR